MNIIFVEPAFPNNQREFVRGLASVGATVIGVGERPADWLDDELKGWMAHYHQIPNVTDVGALGDLVAWVQDKLWVDRIESTIEAHTMAVAQVREARGMVDIVCVQNHYNLARRDDDDLIDELAADGIAYVPFFPLGGFTPLQSGTLDRVAQRLGHTPMQVALAWLLRRSPNILLIPGTSSVAHLRENLAVAEIDLAGDALAELDGIARAAA